MSARRGPSLAIGATSPALRVEQVYLSTEQLATRTPWSPDAIQKLVARGLLKAGVHFFQPFGRRSQRLFKWDAVASLIEGKRVHPVREPMIELSAERPDRPPALRAIDVEKAKANLQRLLT